ncbi:MAG: exo-alpha-sialidase [Pirellulaceae bacterium]|nr:exo-alpha-sialidase [Pirellulaceae bacterium]
MSSPSRTRFISWRVILLFIASLNLSDELLYGEDAPEFTVQLDVVKQELDPGFCWFHPRVVSIPGGTKDGRPLIMLTLQKHLVADDHYSGLHVMTTVDLGKTWTGPMLPKELDWRKGDNGETIAVCDVTPAWHPQAKKVIAIGTQLRYSAAGGQLLDKPRSHEFAYAVYDPATTAWTSWQTLAMPLGEGQRFNQVAPGCVQWLVKPDGTLLVPVYYQGAQGGPYSVTVVHASWDGGKLKYLAHGDELQLHEVRGLCEPSLAFFQGKHFLTLRNDNRGYVTTSKDGLKYAPIRPWVFDDGQDLGSYNTQQHWVVHSRGLFLVYTRRGANNDHIARKRAPLFMAQVDPEKLHVLRRTEKELMPERGVMLGNFGAAAVDENETWVTDSEYITGGKAHPRGANGSTFAARIQWKQPNELMPAAKKALP